VNRWIKDYEGHCRGAAVSYRAAGSSTGVAQLTSGSVDFGATDAVLTADQEQAADAKNGSVVHVPWSGGGVAVEYHLPNNASLHLTSDSLVGIFSGAITDWADPRLTADNPGAKLPAGPIHVLYRSDDNPATAALSGYLAATAAGRWTWGVGSHLATWPTGRPVDGAAAMGDALDQTTGAIGYAEASAPRPASVALATVKNAAGTAESPSALPMTAALAEATVPPDLKVVPNYTPKTATAYPITFPTWVVVFARSNNAGDLTLLKDFLHYAVDEGQFTAGTMTYAPIPPVLRDRDDAAIDAIGSSATSTTTTTSPTGAAAAGSTTVPGHGAAASSPSRNNGALVFPPPPGGNGGATGVGVTGSAIAVGNVSTSSGPIPNVMSGAAAGTAAFFAFQSSVGGVYGRGLTLLTADDGSDPNQNQAAYANLAGKVLGFVGSFSMVDDAAAAALSHYPDAPDVSEATNRAHFGLANNFSVAPFPPGSQLGPLNYFAAKYGSGVVSHMAILILDTPTAKDAAAGEQAAATSVGYRFVYSRVFEPTETSFDSDVVNMQHLGVQGVTMVGDAASMARLALTMQRQNFRPPFVNWGANAYAAAFLGPAGHAADGSVIDQPLAMYAGEDSLPEVETFLHWLKQVAPNQAPDIFAAYGWESARLFVQALGAAGPHATRAAVMAALEAIDNFDGNGMLAPAGPASKRPPTCFMTIGVSNGAFTRSDPASGFICDRGGYYFAH
ncbi:MAG: substrate-binding domain-containing protein, partial [Acidimicrobiia bacterium]|nr:substrate-binding domain-containing protein [Acidimicrobiia bacterium]